MDWRLKGSIQGVLARLPWGSALNDRLQLIAGGRRDCAAHTEAKVNDDWLVHMAILRDMGFVVQGRDLLEIGTGWLPVFPLCYALVGARRCFTYDLNRHLRFDAVPATLEALERHLSAIAAAAGQPEATVRERWQRLTQLGDGARMLEGAAVVYNAPADATTTALGDDSVAMVFSNSVLEHVSATVLGPLMRETHRVLEPDGLALHSVNCGDHYAYFDPTITPIHYLRYSDRHWRWWNNELLYQNRLRPVDFLAAARAAQLDVVLDLHRPREELIAKLDCLPIAPEFRHYAPEELCCTSITFAATPVGKSSAAQPQ